MMKNAGTLDIALTEAMKFDTRLHDIMDALVLEMT